jgi:hypothetical protein
VKPCPFCEAELRDSVIKCTSCGRSLLGDPESSPEHEPAVARSASSTGAPGPGAPGLGAPTVSGGNRGSKLGFPPAGDPPAAPTVNAWATGPSQTASPTSDGMQQRMSTLRALPNERRRAGRPDWVLLLVALFAIGAAVIAWNSIGQPWVKLTITDTSDRMDPQLVGDITLRAQASMLGMIGRGLAVALGVYGLLWLVYGFDRGSTVPWFANPAGAILVTIAGLIGTVVSAMVWFVWEDVAVSRAKAVKMSVDELNELLHLQPEPLVQIERLTGLVRFGGAMVIGLLAACAAWWCARKRI